jgi:cyanate permease
MREASTADVVVGKSDAMGADHGFTASQAVRTSDFWKLMVLTALICGTVQSLIVHFIGLSAEYGVSSTSATVALSALSLVGPAGPLLAGTLADRVSGPKPLALFYGLPLLGFLALILLGAAAAIPAMILIGLGFQTATGMLPYLMTRYFGVRYASQLFGISLGVMTLSMGTGPVILGFARDRLQNFASATPVLLALLAGTLALCLTLRKYEPTHRPAPAVTHLS